MTGQRSNQLNYVPTLIFNWLVETSVFTGVSRLAMVSASLLTMWLPNTSKLQNRSSACKKCSKYSQCQQIRSIWGIATRMGYRGWQPRKIGSENRLVLARARYGRDLLV